VVPQPDHASLWTPPPVACHAQPFTRRFGPRRVVPGSSGELSAECGRMGQQIRGQGPAVLKQEPCQLTL
jgi:hypothetical protein